MCGIIGGNGFRENTIKSGLEKTIHRGRDNSSFVDIDGFFVGHNRLSIQDLSETANQPMWDVDNEVCIVYNGELWDSVETSELKKSLKTKFRTKSDTEVILNAYLERGVDSFEMFILYN